MMRALGVLDEGRTGAQFTADTTGPVQPGKDAPALLSAHHRTRRAQEEAIASAILHGAERARDHAKKLAESNPSSTTLAALAQAHAVLDESDDALAAARDALDLSLVELVSADGEPRLADPTSARLAAEVMVRFDQAAHVFDRLYSVHVPTSLRMTTAVIAVELGRLDDAWAALDAVDGPQVESFRGFLLAARGKHRKAIPHLRRALREDPNDADAAINLSVSLWEIGAHRKAISTALRASRTAPGRRDLSLHYLELLLAVSDVDRLTEEIASLNQRGVIPDARFLIVQARVALEQNALPRAVTLLEKALLEAESEHNDLLRAEIAANLTALRHRMGRLSHEKAIAAMTSLLQDHPHHESIVLCLAKIASRPSEAPLLRRAVTHVSDRITPAQRAYLAHQIAWLEGDNDTAGTAAAEWFDLEPRDPQAAATALVALGIGQERWDEAAAVADFALEEFATDPTIVNNAGYILAMAGRPAEAIRLLEPLADNEFVIKATLGLACLANGDLNNGMRLYREAAMDAEQMNASWHSLMTVYQALVVRQLGLDKSEKPEVISALAIATVPLPADWREQPEFVRLYHVCMKHGYEWPLTL